MKPNELTFFPEVRPCSLGDKCLANFTKTFFDYKQCPCLLQCNRTQYSYSVSMLPLNANYSNYVRTNFADDFLTTLNTSREFVEVTKKSISRIFIFYDTLSYVMSVETATSGSVLDLIANVGGILGLFLGVSVLSLFETFEVIIEICFILYNRQQSKRIKI